MLKKNDLIIAQITDYTNEGNGVARYDDIVVFVPNAAVGDEAQIRIVKVLSSYCYGRLESLIFPSPDRVAPRCPAAGRCGGCDFQHISYEAEKRRKRKFVQDAFSRIGRFDIEVNELKSCEKSEGYRNKAQYPVSTDKDGHLIFGFYAKNSHRIVPCSDCRLEPDIFNEIASFTVSEAERLGITAYSEETGSGILRHIYLRRAEVTGQIMLCLVVADPSSPALRKLAEKAKDEFSAISTVLININRKKTNVILGPENIVVSGKGYIDDLLCGVRVEISPHSFYQVNHDGAQELYSIAKESLELTGDDDLLDLYCGTGSIGLSMADSVRSLIGVEIVPQAVENARKNAEYMGLSNTRFICADAGKAATELAREGIRPTAVVLDPPRKGCDEPTLSSIIRMSPDRISMISCNPVTAARDCRYLCDNGYRLVFVQPFDMFPRTRHCESIAILERKN